jgi:hypothetical protein
VRGRSGGKRHVKHTLRGIATEVSCSITRVHCIPQPHLPASHPPNHPSSVQVTSQKLLLGQVHMTNGAYLSFGARYGEVLSKSSLAAAHSLQLCCLPPD